MGVSGSGKSSFATMLAAAIDAEFIDADDFHSEQSKVQMARGIALTDRQRLPWIKGLCELARERYRLNRPFVMACSLLRQEHRKLFYQNNMPLTLIYLRGDKALIRQRLEMRTEHFFSVSLLDDQFAMLQPPDETEPCLCLDVKHSLQSLVTQTTKYLDGLNQ